MPTQQILTQVELNRHKLRTMREGSVQWKPTHHSCYRISRLNRNSSTMPPGDEYLTDLPKWFKVQYKPVG
jgi:hypothetical protein